MEECLKRLSELILYEMGRKNQSCICFAELCGLSRNELSYIINRKKKDLRLSTIFRIIENSDIKIEDIFCESKTKKDQELFDKILRSHYFTDGRDRYYLIKK